VLLYFFVGFDAIGPPFLAKAFEFVQHNVDKFLGCHYVPFKNGLPASVRITMHGTMQKDATYRRARPPCTKWRARGMCFRSWPVPADPSNRKKCKSLEKAVADLVYRLGETPKYIKSTTCDDRIGLDEPDMVTPCLRKLDLGCKQVRSFSSRMPL